MQELTQFLISAFSADEFRRFIRFNSGDKGDYFESMIPGPNSSPYSIISETIKMLRNHDAINDKFFDALIKERPRREIQINKLRNSIVKW